MSIPTIFSFENNAVRTLGAPESPLFVAVDICSSLGYANSSKAIKDHVDPEDLIKSEIIDKLNRIQTVNCVNESGLYALIFGSKLESAKRFKRWVTSEVLPAIRKTGRYEAPTTLTTEELYEIRKAVKARAKNSSIHYQTIYNALYDYFKIASYKDLTKGQLQAALTFIHTCELKPQLTQPEIPEGALVLEGFEAERIAHFVYYWRYLFRPDLELILRLLQTVNSPKAAQFYEAVTELHLPLLEMTLEKHGYSIKEMSCYKHLVTQRN
jgi:prophage antirepressor-like protein